jgi:Glycosyl hydrolases family 8
MRFGATVLCHLDVRAQRFFPRFLGSAVVFCSGFLACSAERNFLGSSRGGAHVEVPVPVLSATSGAALVPSIASVSTSQAGEAMLDASVPPATSSVPFRTPMREQPNHLSQVLDLTPEEVERRVAEVYRQLFHGNADNQSVYIESASNEGYIYDVAYDRVPLDGMGYGMFVTVQLDQRAEFEALWRYVKRRFPLSSSNPWGLFSDPIELRDLLRCGILGAGRCPLGKLSGVALRR